MLSQFLRAALASAGGAETTQFASISLDSGSIQLPAGIEDGDLIVIVGSAFNLSSTAPTYAIPAGYSSRYNNTAAPVKSRTVRHIGLHKIASASDSSSVVPLFGTAFSRRVVAVVVRFSSPVATVVNTPLSTTVVTGYDGISLARSDTLSSPKIIVGATTGTENITSYVTPGGAASVLDSTYIKASVGRDTGFGTYTSTTAGTTIDTIHTMGLLGFQVTLAL